MSQMRGGALIVSPVNATRNSCRITLTNVDVASCQITRYTAQETSSMERREAAKRCKSELENGCSATRRQPPVLRTLLTYIMERFGVCI